MEQALKPMGLSLEIGMANQLSGDIEDDGQNRAWVGACFPQPMIENNDLPNSESSQPRPLFAQLGAVTHNNRTLSIRRPRHD